MLYIPGVPPGFKVVSAHLVILPVLSITTCLDIVDFSSSLTMLKCLLMLLQGSVRLVGAVLALALLLRWIPLGSVVSIIIDQSVD